MPPAVGAAVRSSFDLNAKSYERYAIFQKETADTLARRVATSGTSGVCLDLGCGPGWLTQRLAQSGSFHTTVALDTSMKMALLAKEKGGALHIAQADAVSLPVKRGSVDLVTSNLMLQWAPDLGDVFAESARVLIPGGVFMATTLGKNTFHEIRDAMIAGFEVCGKKIPDDTFVNFLSADEIELAGRSLFAIETTSVTVRKVYADVKELLRTLKKSGVQNNPGLSFLGLGRRSVMCAFMEKYHQKFAVEGGVGITYEVIYIRAVKI